MKVLAISVYRNYHTSRPEAEVFIGLAKLGVEVHVMSIPESNYKDRLESNGVTFLPWHPTEKFDKEAVDTIRNYAKEHKIDVLQLMNSRAIINGIKAAKGLDVKVVLYRGFGGHIEWYNPASYFKFLNPRVDAIWCNSIGVRNYVGSQSILVKDKAITINKGHNPEWYQNNPIAIRKELEIPADALLLVTAANNRPMKGVKYLMQAMSRLPEDANVHMMLAGRELDNPNNLQHLNEKARDKVHFLGFREDVLDVVKSSDLFVLASIKGESITKAVLEAMSLGVGAIISDISGNVELVNHGENGLVFPSKNVDKLTKSIMQVYENRELIKQFGEKSRERIATVLSNERSVQKVKRLYEGLLAQESMTEIRETLGKM